MLYSFRQRNGFSVLQQGENKKAGVNFINNAFHSFRVDSHADCRFFVGNLQILRCNRFDYARLWKLQGYLYVLLYYEKFPGE